MTINDKLSSQKAIELKIEDAKGLKKLETSLKAIFKKIDFILSKNPDEEDSAKIIVFGDVDDEILEKLDEKLSGIGKRKKTFVIDLVSSGISAESFKKLEWKKAVEKQRGTYSVSEFKEDKKKSKGKAKKKKDSYEEDVDDDQGSLKVKVETYEDGDEEEILNAVIDIILKASKLKNIPVFILKDPTDIEEFKQQIQDDADPGGDELPKKDTYSIIEKAKKVKGFINSLVKEESKLECFKNKQETYVVHGSAKEKHIYVLKKLVGAQAKQDVY